MKGWISVRRPAARGRVAEHAIDLEQLLAATRTVWPAVGPALHSAWFVRLQEAERETTRITLSAPTPFAASYVTSHLSGRLLAAVSAIDPNVMTIRVQCVG